jgi:hypothetical protein
VKRPLCTLAWTNCSRSAGKWVFMSGVSLGFFSLPQRRAVVEAGDKMNAGNG